MIHHTDLHGIEFAGYVAPQLSVAGIDVVMYKSYPMGAKDLSPLLKQVKAADVDAFLAFTYPPETFLITGQAKAIGLNPKLFYMSIGTAFAPYRDNLWCQRQWRVLWAPVPGTRKSLIPERRNSGTGWSSLRVQERLTGMGTPLVTLRSGPGAGYREGGNT